MTSSVVDPDPYHELRKRIQAKTLVETENPRLDLQKPLFEDSIVIFSFKIFDISPRLKLISEFALSFLPDP